MVTHLLSALALILVFEGIMPFLSPAHFRRTLQATARLDERSLRAIGLVCMVAGVVILYTVR